MNFTLPDVTMSLLLHLSDFVLLQWQNVDLLFVVFSKACPNLIVSFSLIMTRQMYVFGSVSLSLVFFSH